jgi:hypothetical protein
MQRHMIRLGKKLLLDRLRQRKVGKKFYNSQRRHLPTSLICFYPWKQFLKRRIIDLPGTIEDSPTLDKASGLRQKW